MYSVALQYIQHAITVEKHPAVRQVLEEQRDMVVQRIAAVKPTTAPTQSSRPPPAAEPSPSPTKPARLQPAIRAVPWTDVIGLENVKTTLQTLITLQQRFPSAMPSTTATTFLFYGVPGTGKSLLSRAVATAIRGEHHFFSSVDFISKWQGESEKNIHHFFQAVSKTDPSAVFVDEFDSIACQRRDDETEATRRVKTTLLTEIDSLVMNNPRCFVMFATNRPWEIESAVLRRIGHKVCIPPPSQSDRRRMVAHALAKHAHRLNDEQMDEIAQRTDRFTGSDVALLVHHAQTNIVRELSAPNTRFMIDGDRYRVWRGGEDGEELALVGMTYDVVPEDRLNLSPLEWRHIEQALCDYKPSCYSDADLQRMQLWTKANGQLG